MNPLKFVGPFVIAIVLGLPGSVLAADKLMPPPGSPEPSASGAVFYDLSGPIGGPFGSVYYWVVLQAKCQKLTPGETYTLFEHSYDATGKWIFIVLDKDVAGGAGRVELWGNGTVSSRQGKIFLGLMDSAGRVVLTNY